MSVMTSIALPLETVPEEDRTPVDTLPGHRAMWVGICLEFLEFAVFFAVYFSARWFDPAAFQTGAGRLWTIGGLLITLAMVSSGYLLTRMLHSLRTGRRRAAQGWLTAALVVGLAYPVLKLLEWRWNQAQGLDAGSGLFVVVYYYLTINHFIHACWGLLGMGYGLVRLSTGSYSPQDHRGLESMAIYWHATDLVWLMIFGLFYAFA
jgi:cytochrome c oxidase subunit 3